MAWHRAARALVLQWAALRITSTEAYWWSMESSYPPCRKSAELHALRPPTPKSDKEKHDSQSLAPALLFFGGKGYEWDEQGRHRFEAEVDFFGMKEMWRFDLATSAWHETKLEAEHDDGRRHRRSSGRVEAPSKRWKFAATSFDDDSRMALFGGCTSISIRDVLDDLWVFELVEDTSHGRWRQVRTENPPAARRGHVLAANETHLVVFGGKSYIRGEGAKVMTDLWTLPLEALRSDADSKERRWTRGADIPTEPRWGSTGTVLRKPHGGDMLGVFGGRVWSGDGTYTYFNDLWMYDFGEDKWEHAKEEDGNAPQARDHHGAAAVGGDLFVFGGRVAATRDPNATMGDVWSFSLATGKWTHHSPGHGLIPAPRFMPAVSGVEFHGKPGLAIAGGEMLPGSTKSTSLNDVWIFMPGDGDEDTGGWQLLSTAWCGPQDFVHYATPASFLAQGPGAWAAAATGLFVVAFFAGAAIKTRVRRAAAQTLEAPASPEIDGESTPYVTMG